MSASGTSHVLDTLDTGGRAKARRAQADLKVRLYELSLYEPSASLMAAARRNPPSASRSSIFAMFAR